MTKQYFNSLPKEEKYKILEANNMELPKFNCYICTSSIDIQEDGRCKICHKDNRHVKVRISK